MQPVTFTDWSHANVGGTPVVLDWNDPAHDLAYLYFEAIRQAYNERITMPGVGLPDIPQFITTLPDKDWQWWYDKILELATYFVDVQQCPNVTDWDNIPLSEGKPPNWTESSVLAAAWVNDVPTDALWKGEYVKGLKDIIDLCRMVRDNDTTGASDIRMAESDSWAGLLQNWALSEWGMLVLADTAGHSVTCDLGMYQAVRIRNRYDYPNVGAVLVPLRVVSYKYGMPNGSGNVVYDTYQNPDYSMPQAETWYIIYDVNVPVGQQSTVWVGDIDDITLSEPAIGQSVGWKLNAGSNEFVLVEGDFKFK